MGQMPMDRHWCEIEFEGVNLGDERLNRRLISTAKSLADQPIASINMACETWPQAKGAYRLFNNKKFMPDEVFRVHHQQTLNRIDAYPFVFAVQDTSYLNYYSHPETLGLGNIGKNQKAELQGLVMHTCLGLSPDGLPLGILDQQLWARDRIDAKKKANRRNIAIEEKESFKWIETSQNVSELLSRSPSEVVHICDREADIYPLMSEIIGLKDHFLIRAAWNRRVNKNEAEHQQLLWDYMQEQPTARSIAVDITAHKGRKARIATCDVRFGNVVLRHSKKQKRAKSLELLPSINVYVVWVKEMKPPKGQKALEWMLLTDIAIKDADDAVQKIQWYRLRWQIENYHKILKSGCRVEDSRLQSAERLERHISLLSIIAWRLHWMTHINRANPNESASKILEDHEWKALYCKIHNTKNPPARPPTADQAIRWIAQLGGFLARKSDGDPGITTLWRGYQRLCDIAETYLLFHPTTCG
jgi:hypothetical protein